MADIGLENLPTGAVFYQSDEYHPVSRLRAAEPRSGVSGPFYSNRYYVRAMVPEVIVEKVDSEKRNR